MSKEFDNTHDLYKILYTIKKEIFEKKKIQPNVDFYASGVYLMIGIPDKLSPMLTLLARIGGMCAHLLEQKYVTKKIIVQTLQYNGNSHRKVMNSRF